jgi:hypothetical protein
LVKANGNRVLPMFDSDLRPVYRRALRKLITQNKANPEKYSIRRLARDCKVSHPTLMTAFDDPEKEVSRRTMEKIVLNTFPRKKSFVKKRMQRGAVGMWCADVF